MSETVTVLPGDTLWSIAARHLGDGRRWREIYQLNERAIRREQQRFPEARRKMRGPDWIFPDTTLQIPKQ